ncbi:phytanoyl-CoA dioxygenase family protein [Talaromyces stipitatus ATCC 10500]|uniref:Phytanoyl-CoA dioxygenase family protein n=1 Tax=Talaromyces stipitatus (strain ATCC 10500 / CBS 375.48 / QM 6759 / NRRL 1006) TaxID=441959 RepID=B8MVE5_TALSN|nr:phytanoyl-CoA dioxygenase family protein [Talaromyces stipitatus ATCC 10500]EED11454.1 phytanoyl-CoA dioxygenase family protein [Talaromyces stipitatus ATCC 10500]
MTSVKDPAYNTISTELGSYTRKLIKPIQWEPKIEAFIKEVQENGFVIIRDAFSMADIAETKVELTQLASSGRGGPAGTKGRNAFEGYQTGRIYALLDKSRIFDKFILHTDVMALNDFFLDPGFQINAFHSVSIQPGEQPQTLHHDDGHITVPRPHLPFGTGVIVALDAFTETNGATVVVPKSHLWDDKRRPDRGDTLPVVMESGSMVYFLSTLWHGGGGNSSGETRDALNMQYCQPWIRPFENHILAVSWDKLSQIPPKLVDMMGYKVAIPMVGHVEGSSPLSAVTRRLEKYHKQKSPTEAKL